MAKPRDNGLPPGARLNPDSGRVTLMFEVVEQGKVRRLSQHSILPTEPRSYPNDVEIVRAGYKRVLDFLALRVERGSTVHGFYEEWTDLDHHRWGLAGGRSESTIGTRRSVLKHFVSLHGEKKLLEIDEALIDKFMSEEGGRYSHLMVLDVFFSDAKRVNKIVKHPCRELAAGRAIAEADRRNRTRPPVPSELQIDRLLEVVSLPPYPPGLWGWLFLGMETGMRPGELDAMKWRWLDGDEYQIEEQFNAETRTFTAPKHDSFRALRLSDDALAAIEHFRGNGSEFLFTNLRGDHWRAPARDKWWGQVQVDGLTLRDLVDGLSIYNSTRHYWATMALNKWGIPLRKAAAMFGHKDGGLTMHRTYVRKDMDAASDVQAALNARPSRLNARRRRAA